MKNNQVEQSRMMAAVCERTGFRFCGTHECVDDVSAYIVRKGHVVAKVEPFHRSVTVHVWSPGWQAFARKLPVAAVDIAEHVENLLHTVDEAFSARDQ